MILIATSALSADAQALPNVNPTRVLYNARRTTVNPRGELRAQVDAVDRAIAAATKRGQLGEVRRQIARGPAHGASLATTGLPIVLHKGLERVCVHSTPPRARCRPASGRMSRIRPTTSARSIGDA